ncbi:MAG: membrane bound O-acyl transferase family-domain-containing protein [Fimbriimonas ginsengisoli]|uniref:Membrane bound O-acyl transferase family-domain-containing protein n=1 Tax=Fimbriimonas ginsengisoli TaxID=1005039 RepID=A0A931PW23_FIMGI|nr:membrane bound O-acyl transferase family-domain-containing protein [Fimbriimonas ginsengisoli]
MNAERLAPWIVVLVMAALMPLLPSRPAARRVGQVALVLAGIGLLTIQASASPGWKLLCASLLFLYLMKGVVLLALPAAAVRRTPALPYLAFFTVWPGMAIEGLQERRAATPSDVQGFGRGLTRFFLGIGLVLIDALLVNRIPALAAAWICVGGLLLAIHLGFSEVLTCLIRLAGRPVDPLFLQPGKSISLEDFWSRRWNRPFVEMDRRLFLRPLMRMLGRGGAMVAVFLISGLLHEMAISYPVGDGWGLPSGYFLLQAAAMLAQNKLRIRSPLWTWGFVLIPLPILFHPPFLLGLPLELVRLLHWALAARPAEWYLNILLWAMPAAQLLVLAASRQVPERLKWAEELPRLGPFNRKLMWTYGIFVVFTIVAFAVVTLVLHAELMRGDRAAVAFAIFVAAYWTLRLGFDNFYFKAADWPEGAEFVVGHALLNSLFAFLTLSYGMVAFWRVLGG